MSEAGDRDGGPCARRAASSNGGVDEPAITVRVISTGETPPERRGGLTLKQLVAALTVLGTALTLANAYVSGRAQERHREAELIRTVIELDDPVERMRMLDYLSAYYLKRGDPGLAEWARQRFQATGRARAGEWGHRLGVGLLENLPGIREHSDEWAQITDGALDALAALRLQDLREIAPETVDILAGLPSEMQRAFLFDKDVVYMVVDQPVSAEEPAPLE